MTSSYRPSQVVRRTPRRPESNSNLPGALAILLIGLAGIGGALFFFSDTESADATPVARATSAQVADGPPATVDPGDAPTPPPPLPSSTPLPPASPTPTSVGRPAATLAYTTRSGDTLAALAARFGVNPADIQPARPLVGQTTLAAGQLLSIPRAFAEVGPGYVIVPDSETVYSRTSIGFDAAQFAAEQGGYLSRYKGFVDGATYPGGAALDRLALQHSLHPRLLLALLEHQSGWVTNPGPDALARERAFGLKHPYRKELMSQLNWAAAQLNIGFYGWRAGTLTTLTFPDGSSLRIDPALNAGTVAVQYFFAQLLDRDDWQAAVGPDGLAATYRRLFGDPFDRDVAYIPADLTQPPMALPFLAGHTWYFSGGPHGAWDTGGAQAALDFAPASAESGCAESQAWVAAVAAGHVVRAEGNTVALDLDGDGRESTGWVIFYFHLAEAGRIAADVIVEAGDRLGHPSCEGGRATGTHVHLARKYNGEWIPADGPVPFTLSGWVAQPSPGEYLGSLARDGVTVRACDCTAAWTAIRAEP